MLQTDPLEWYYDSEVDIIWIGSSTAGEYSHSVDIGDTGIVIDLDKSGHIKGVEILAASRGRRKKALKGIEISREGVETRKIMGAAHPRARRHK